jgi:hypothetical protein
MTTWWAERAVIGSEVREHVVIDSGHTAGRRLRDYAFFDQSADPRNALLIECGQHWERAAPEVARQAARHRCVTDVTVIHGGRIPRGVRRP